MEGRRVESGDLRDRGDYYLDYADDGSIARLWGIAPEGSWTRLPATGHGNGEEPEWTITEDAEGRVTVDPSIKISGGAGMRQELWHGHLKAGVWT